MKIILAATFSAALAFAISSAPAQSLYISEVHPTGSSASYAADWFELTNPTAITLDITGWRVDDSSAAFASALPLRGVTSIAPGKSVVFAEGSADGSTDASIQANFRTAWFGANAPANFTMGGYGGAGIGLSSGGDAVNIYNSTGALMASVSFGAATTGTTFDNAAALNNASLTTLSSPGVNGAFTSTISEVGSPGVIPEPSTAITLLGGAGLLIGLRRRGR